MHPLNQFKKSGGAYVTRDELDEILAPILAALEVSEPATVVYALDEPEPEPEDVPAHPGESDPEGINLVKEIHERKSRGKRKPEGVDPLGLVPDPQGE